MGITPSAEILGYSHPWGFGSIFFVYILLFIDSRYNISACNKSHGVTKSDLSRTLYIYISLPHSVQPLRSVPDFGGEVFCSANRGSRFGFVLWNRCRGTGHHLGAPCRVSGFAWTGGDDSRSADPLMNSGTFLFLLGYACLQYM